MMPQNQAIQNRPVDQNSVGGATRPIGQVEQVQSTLHSTVGETERLIEALAMRFNIVLRAEPPTPATSGKEVPQEYMVEMASALRSTLYVATRNNEQLQSILDRAEL